MYSLVNNVYSKILNRQCCDVFVMLFRDTHIRFITYIEHACDWSLWKLWRIVSREEKINLFFVFCWAVCSFYFVGEVLRFFLAFRKRPGQAGFVFDYVTKTSLILQKVIYWVCKRVVKNYSLTYLYLVCILVVCQSYPLFYVRSSIYVRLGMLCFSHLIARAIVAYNKIRY